MNETELIQFNSVELVQCKQGLTLFYPQQINIVINVKVTVAFVCLFTRLRVNE